MKSDQPLVFWQNMPTHHQSGFLSALAAKYQSSVAVAIEADIPRWRREMGWEIPDYGAAKVDIGLDATKVERIIADSGAHAIHIFGGIDAYPWVHTAFRQCLSKGRKMGVMAESETTRGFRGNLRNLAWHLKGIRYRHRLDFVLAIGEGPQGGFFYRNGFRAERIFDFAYFPPAPSASDVTDERLWIDGAIRLIFVGNLIPRKGIEHLLRALKHVRSGWHLRLVGGGEREAMLRSLVRELDLETAVRFDGPLSNNQALETIGGADLLVLPSNSEGWGAVVNEALYRGVPVICSDKCGSRHVVDVNAQLGCVFAFRAKDGLSRALDYWIARGRRTPQERKSIKKLSHGLLPEAGATYFMKVIDHVYGQGARPVPPWYAGGAED